jgi:hypothetical protein
MSTSANVRLAAAATGPSLAEGANLLFLELVRRLSGVVHVEAVGAETVGEQAFRVYVRDGDLTAERAVYLAKGSVYDAFPDAVLDVEVLEESDLSQAGTDGRRSDR